MRLRRAVQALLRRRRIDEREMSYREIVWENAMEAYDESPGPVVDITPYIQDRLDAAKHELLLKAQRTKRERDRRRRERRRRVAAVAAAGSTMLAAGAGASAIADFSTGVEPLDALLGTLRDELGGSTSPNSPTAADRTPVPGSTVSLQAHTGIAEPARVGASFYLSEDRDLCFVKGVFIGEGVRETTGGGACAPLSVVDDDLAEKTAYLAGASVDRTGVVLVAGYAAPSVREMRIGHSAASLDVHLSGPWTPDSQRPSKVKAFLAVGTVSVPQGGLGADLLDQIIDPQGYAIEVEVDGTWRRLTPPARAN
jgi:hypothetical protein